MRKLIAIAFVAACLAGCGVVETLTSGFKHAQAVETDLEEATGIKPAVGFNWHNGRLVSVTVTFPQPYDAKPLRELADMTRAAVVKEFQQTPENVVLAFALGGAPSPTAQGTPTQ
jgi:hypothetical protein